MKKLQHIFFLSVAFALTVVNVCAQSWVFTGNAGTATSFVGTTNNFALRFKTNTASVGTTIDRMIILPSGNVGVATSNPTSLLSLGSAAANSKLAVLDNGTSLRAGFGWATGQLRMHLSATTDKFSFLGTEASATDLMTILGTGNVGIGVAAPGQRLDVGGNIRGTGFILPTGAAAGRVLTSDATGTATWQAVSYTETDPTVGAHIKSIATTDISNWNAKENAIAFNNGLTRTANTVQLGGSLIQNTQINIPDGNYLQLRTNNTLTSGFNATSKIHAGANFTSHYGVNNPQNWALFNIYENNIANGENPTLLSMSTPSANSANGWMFYNYGDAGTVFPKMITKSNYLVGGFHVGYEHVVNTVDPNSNVFNYAYLLTFTKNTDANSFIPDNYQTVQYSNLFAIRNAGAIMFNLSATGQLRLPYYLNDAAESKVLTTDINGNLKLKTFAGGTGAVVGSNGLSTFGSTIKLGGTLDQNTIVDMASYNFSYMNGTAQAMQIAATGNVAIGSVVTSKTLLVRKDVGNGLGSTIELLNGGAQNPPVGNTNTDLLRGSVSIDLNTYENTTANKIISQIKAISTGDFGANIVFSSKDGGTADGALVERMRIASNGNVAIGTTDPKNYKLAIAGPMVAEKVVVKLQQNWPDYVFENNYNLRSIPDLAQYIQKHKHLPGLTSAENMKKQDGVDIGAIQVAMLEKIEELTLYIIEKDKQLNEQKKLIDQISARLAVMEKKQNNN